MKKILSLFGKDEVDFKPYHQKENDFKRIAYINIFVCFFILPIFCLFILETDIPIIYCYLIVSYIIFFPIVILCCWYIRYLRDKLYLFYIIFIYAITLVAFIDLVNQNFSILDLLSFYCLFIIGILGIQRFYFGLLYSVFVVLMFIYSFQFVNDNQPISKYLILCFTFTISLAAIVTSYSRYQLLLSIFDFNSYLRKISHGDKFGFFLFRIDNEVIKVLDFDSGLGRTIVGDKSLTKENFSLIINEKFSKKDIRNVVLLEDDQYLTKIVRFNNKNFEFVISSIKLKKKDYFLVKANDVTERFKEQEELIRSEERYRNLYNENQAGIFTLNLSFQIINYNKTFDQMFENIFKLGSLFVENDDEMRELLELISETKKLNNYQTHFTLKNGTIKWLVFNFYYDSQNNLIEGSVVDVSDIQKATNALRKSEEKYKLIYESSNDAIILLDGNRVVDVNKRGMQLFGIPKDNFLSLNLWDLSFETSVESNTQLKIYLTKLKQSGTVRFNWIFKGRFNPIEAEVSIVELVIGNQVMYQCVIHDVTDKNNTIRALEKSTENFKSVLDSVPEGIFILQGNDILYANKEMYELIGSDIINPEVLFIEEDQQVFKDLLERKKSSSKPILGQLNLERNNSESILVDITIVNTVFGSTDAVLILLKDVSLQMQLSKEVLRAELAEENNKKLESEIKERIRTERELQNLLLKTKAIYDSSSNIFLLTLDLNGIITYFNKHSKIYFYQLTKNDIYTGVSIIDYFSPYFSDELMNEFGLTLEKVINGRSIQFEVEFKNNDLSKWIQIFMNPIYDTDGQVSEISLICHDITVKKQAEVEIFESLHEKEILLKEIHHRVKNNLQVISSILNLQSSFVTDERTLEVLLESRNRIRSMAIIHENLYRTTNFASIDFANYLKNLAINLLALYHRKDIEIDIIYDLQKVDISLDQAVPCGLIMNELITNSMKYAFINSTNERNELLISMSEKNGIINLRVKDNGIGLSPELDIKNSDTLGLQLVVTLSEQLDAELKYKIDNGTDFLISFEKI